MVVSEPIPEDEEKGLRNTQAHLEGAEEMRVGHREGFGELVGGWQDSH